MSATNELRAMLDERGVKWDYGIGGASTTEFMTSSGLALSFMDWRDRLTCTTLLTPEQAIAATLGRGECHIKPWKMERDTGFYDCMECECGYVSDVSDWAKWHFCPNCGAKVVDE